MTRAAVGIARRDGGIVLVVAYGLLLVAMAGYIGRVTGDPPAIVYWSASTLLFAVPAWKVLAPGVRDGDRIAYTVLGAVALLGSRLLLYPTAFVYHDEMLHRNMLRLITTEHRLFVDNSLLPVTKYYPGLEAATFGVHAVTHLSLHASEVVVLVLARVVMTLALITVFARIGGSLQVGCLAATVYAANPQYAWFNSQYSYQSLCLPLCFLAAAVFATRATPRGWRGIAGAAASAAAAIATHHLTALAFAALLVAWLVVGRLLGRRRPGGGTFVVLVVSFFVAWTLHAGGLLFPYVDEITRHSWQSALDLLHGHSDHRLFQDSAGDHTPVWERLVSLASVLVIMALLLPAAWRAREVLRRRHVAAILLLAVALLYPLIPGGHLTNATAEVSDRSSGFIFVGLGFVLARWSPLGVSGRGRRFRLAALTTLVVLFVGGAVVGSGPSWLRAPGRFLVAADNRSIDPVTIASGRWIGEDLPPGSRVLADRGNALTAAVYGRAHAIANLADDVDMNALSRLLLGGADVPHDIEQARRARLDFLIADVRIASSLPHVGVYIESGEVGSNEPVPRASPPAPAALRVFDGVHGVDRVYDNGSVVIYDFRRLR